MPLSDPSKFAPKSLLRNELPHDVSINDESNKGNKSDDKEIYTQT